MNIEGIEYDEFGGGQISDITDAWNGSVRRVECTVYVPDDMFEGDNVTMERLDYAIDAAREGLPDWVNICNWYGVWDNGNEVRVARESRI